MGIKKVNSRLQVRISGRPLFTAHTVFIFVSILFYHTCKGYATVDFYSVSACVTVSPRSTRSSSAAAWLTESASGYMTYALPPEE